MEKVTISSPSTNLLKNYAAQTVQKKESFTSEQPEPAKELMSKEAADASKAYSGVAAAKKSPFEKKSLEDKKAELLNNGKVEGKDFKINNAGKSFTTLEIYADGKPSEIFMYNNGASADDLESYTKISYCLTPETTGLKASMTNYDKDGNFKYRSNIYEKDKSPYKDCDVNFETEPEDLTEQFKAKNIKFSIEKSQNGEFTSEVVTAFDNDKISKYEFICDINGDPLEVRRYDVGSDGRDIRYVGYGSDETTYVEYKDSFKQ